MTEPQVWVLIGVFGTAIFGMLSWQTVSFNRNLTLVRDSLQEGMNLRFAAQDAKLDARFARLESKLENMDSDIQAISRRVFGSDPH